MSFFKQLFATRKNPYKPWANQRDRVEINLSGTRLSMELPPHSNIEGFTREPAPKSVNIYDGSQYDSEDGLPERQKEGICLQPLFSRQWDFRGPPWERWPYGTMTFAASIIRHDALPDEMSCFNPEHFEQVILRSAHFRGPAQFERAKVLPPTNWRVEIKQDNRAIYYESHLDLSDPNTEYSPFDAARATSSLHIPMDDRYYILVNFSYSGYCPVEDSLRNMNQIRDHVLASVRCELSPSAKKQLSNARLRWPTANAKENPSIANWEYPKWTTGNPQLGEPNIIITEEGTAAPILSP